MKTNDIEKPIQKVSQAMGRNLWTFIVGPLFKVIEAIFDLLIPLFMKAVIDLCFTADLTTVDPISRTLGSFISSFGTWIASDYRLNYAIVGGTIILLMGIVGFSTTMVCQYVATLAATKTGTDLRNALYEKIMSLSKRDLENFSKSKAMTILNSDSYQVQQGVHFFIRLGVRAPFIILGSLVISFILDWHIGFVFLAIIPVIFLIVFLVMRRASKEYLVIQGKLDSLSNETDDDLEGSRVVRAFYRMDYEKEKFQEGTRSYKEKAIKVNKLNSFINPLTFAIVSIATILVVLIGGFDMANSFSFMGSVVLPSTIIALVSYLSQIFQTLVVVTNLVTIFTKSIVSSKRCNSLLAIVPSIQSDGKNLTKSINKGDTLFQFKDVCLSYQDGGNNALSDITFSLKKGESLGLIGGTGSGKSTLARVLMRLLDTTQGELLYKGEDIKDYDLHSLRKEIAYAPQKAVLFKGSVRTNMEMAKKDCSDKEIEDILSISMALDFVKEKGGLDTEVEEGGKNFSGGQRQRLSLARTLLRNSEVIILDDTTSALDLLTERKIRENIKERYSDATKIIISQRVSSIMDCDLILVLEGGRIVSKGNHEQLLEESEVYKEIYQTQMERGNV